MTTNRQNITILLWTIPILFVCGLIVYFDSSLNTCYGLVHVLGDLFLLLILCILSLIFIVRQIYKIARNVDNKNIRILACIIVIIATIFAFLGKTTWKDIRLGNSILKASVYADQLDIGQIELINEEKYYAIYGHIDWSCAFTDKYKIVGDTLILGGNPFGKTDGILTDKYIMTDSTLIPIKTLDMDMNQTEIMVIEKKR